jgi:hypothetical protein
VKVGDYALRLVRAAAAHEEVPDVGLAGDEGLDHLRPHAADQDGRVRALHRLRVEGRILELVVLAREGRPVLAEQ